MSEKEKLKESFKELKKVLKEIFRNRIIRTFLIVLIFIFYMFLIDFALKHYARFYVTLEGFSNVTSYIFTLSFCVLFFIFFFLFKKRGKLILFNFFTILFLIIFFAEYFHFKTLGRFFGIGDLGLATEATGFLSMILPAIQLPFVLITFTLIFLIIFGNLIIRKLRLPKIKKFKLIILIVIFILLRIGAFISLGEEVPEAQFNSVYNPKNVYNKYEDYTRALAVSGVPEYSFRNVYLSVKNKLFSMSDKEMIKKVNKYAKKHPYTHEDNEYTGIFKDKNVIYILMESIDSFLVNDEVMPTLTKLSEEGLNFTNRYAPTFGGGKTFNTEFAMLTGLYQPLNGSASFSYADNDFRYTFPKMFIEKGYTSESVHFNTRDMYNRGNMHDAIGFQKYNGSLNEVYGDAFEYDSILGSNQDTYNLITKGKEDKFANFVITLSAHGDYNASSYMCEKLVKDYSNLVVDGDYETSCVRAKAHDTDVFLSTLLEKLEKDGILDDTVLVLATDHEMYGYSKVYQMKGVTNNLVTKVPFIIWSEDIEHKNVDTIMDSADILPTVANMFDLDYTPVFSMGTDVFDKNHENYVYFSDYSWYDGNIYYKPTDEVENTDYIKKINKEIREKIKIGRYVLDSDYYRNK